MKTVKLIKPHRHDGVDYDAGAILKVPEEVADFLASRGIATIEEKPKPPKP